MTETDDTLIRSDYALYLIDELAALLARTSLTDWPERQANLFLRRLQDINAATAEAAS